MCLLTLNETGRNEDRRGSCLLTIGAEVGCEMSLTCDLTRIRAWIHRIICLGVCLNRNLATGMWMCSYVSAESTSVSATV